MSVEHHDRAEDRLPGQAHQDTGKGYHRKGVHREGTEMRKLFGTDGVRGVANQDPMTSEMALRIGRAAADVFRDSARRHRIVIGKDTRLAGCMIESAPPSGLCFRGMAVFLVGPVPTP